MLNKRSRVIGQARGAPTLNKRSRVVGQARGIGQQVKQEEHNNTLSKKNRILTSSKRNT
jgi:hypothetical protein